MIRARSQLGIVVVSLAGCAALTACISPTESCGRTRSLQGSWSYTAVQENPVRATISGTLVVAEQSCSDFSGTIDVVEVTSVGERRRLAGPVTGVLLDSTSARFSATLGSGDREHLARFAGDSVRGTWVEAASGSASAGSFSGRQGGK